MAEIKFSQLTTAAQLTNDDIFALAQMQGGSLSSVKTSMIAVANYLNTQVQYTTAYNTQAKTTAGAINELKQLISLIPQFAIEVVEELPTEDISDTTIYLVPAEDPEVGNYYEEYIHVNDSWELVGTTAVDLSAYYTKLEVDGLLATKASVTEVALKENKTDMPTDVRTIIKDCKTPKNATITNGIAQFECIEENLVKGLKVTMNPIQDLHGYSNPWAGGAGKNKLPITLTEIKQRNTAGTWTNNIYAYRDVTITVNTTENDDYITSISFSGTISQVSSFVLCEFNLPAGTYKANGCNFGSRTTTRLLFQNISTSAVLATLYSGQEDVEFTIESQTSVRCYFVIANDQTSGTFYPMIRLSTVADGTFAPYSNICPISGRTEASVVRTAGEDVETKTHQYSETIYGGVDDFVNGGATSEWNFKTITSVNSIGGSGTEASPYFFRILLTSSEIGINTAIENNQPIANYFKTDNTSSHVLGGTFLTSNGGALHITFADQSIDTTEKANTYLTNNPLQVCYKLATPTTISTSAEEITTVAGTNIISGTEPISECKYTELATVDDLRKIIGGQ